MAPPIGPVGRCPSRLILGRSGRGDPRTACRPFHTVAVQTTWEATVAQFDLPLDKLRAYRPDLSRPDDFDAFWAGTLADARSHPLDAPFEPFDNDLAVVDTFDVTFRGFGGSPSAAAAHPPAHAAGTHAGAW